MFYENVFVEFSIVYNVYVNINNKNIEIWSDDIIIKVF